MNIFKKFLQNKKNAPSGMPEMYEVNLKKIFDTANFLPLEYEHSAKFLKDGADPVQDEKNRLKGQTTDWLLKDSRVPAIKADTQSELTVGKLQYFNHIYSILTIQNLENGVYFRSNDEIKRVTEEIARLDEDLRVLEKKLAKGEKKHETY